MDSLFQSLGDALRPAGSRLSDYTAWAVTTEAIKKHGDSDRRYGVIIGSTEIELSYIVKEYKGDGGPIGRMRDPEWSSTNITIPNNIQDLEIAVELAIEEIERHDIRYE